MLSLSTIKNAVNGRLQVGGSVMCRDQNANYQLRWKNNRRTITIYPHGDDDIRVNCHAGQNPIEVKDWVRRQIGLPAWKPKRRKPLPPLAVRRHYLNESLRIAEDRKTISADQFTLIINDLKNADETFLIPG
jgi:hypothetical protein